MKFKGFLDAQPERRDSTHWKELEEEEEEHIKRTFNNKKQRNCIHIC